MLTKHGPTPGAALCPVCFDAEATLDRSIHVHLWHRDKVGLFMRGDFDGVFFDLANAPAKIDEMFALLLTRHPDMESIDVTAVWDVATKTPRRTNRPPDPTKSAAQIATETKQARYDALRAKGNANLTIAERTEAQALAFELGMGPPPPA
mgnify:CR=1 FL=1